MPSKNRISNIGVETVIRIEIFFFFCTYAPLAHPGLQETRSFRFLFFSMLMNGKN